MVELPVPSSSLLNGVFGKMPKISLVVHRSLRDFYILFFDIKSIIYQLRCDFWNYNVMVTNKWLNETVEVLWVEIVPNIYSLTLCFITLLWTL